MPRVTQLARTQQTLYTMHAENARRFNMLRQPAEAAESQHKAVQAKADYDRLVALKRMLEGSRLNLDAAAGLVAWNAEVAALVGAMPEGLQQDLGGEFALYFAGAGGSGASVPTRATQ